MTLRISASLPGFAGRVEGLDATMPLDESVRQQLYAGLLDYEVLLLPAQVLTPDAHVALADVFGTCAAGAFFPRKDGHPKLEVIECDAEHPPELNVWHSDVTWLERPPTGTVIQLVVLPASGGNTVWSSMSKAFDALSGGMKTYLRGLTATHTWENSIVRDALATAGDDKLIDAVKRFKPVQHPVVRRHPESGKEVLFVNETFTRCIDGVPYRESRALLSFLYEWIVQPEFCYSHRWEPNGIAVWDNRSTQHYAAADYYPSRRVVHRVTFNTRVTDAAATVPV
jgi:taurine dioxygenase